MLRLRVALALVAVMAAASLPGWWSESARRGFPERAVVTDAIDGDTVEVTWGRGRATVRILGVDTPETHHPNRPVECFGPEAAAFTERLLLGEEVGLTYDTDRVDIYGRLLADLDLDGASVADTLLRNGYARLLVIPPNGTRGRDQLDIELSARHRGAGLWSACR